MKKKASFLFLISLIVGAVVGYVRSDIFIKHYDGFAGVILSSASMPLMLMTAFLVIFAAILFIKCKSLFGKARLSRKLTALDKVLVALGCVAIGISAYFAILNADGGFFEKAFAISAVIAVIYFVAAMFSVRGTMTDILSSAAVLPAALVLLSIYKTNIRYPNISLFAFEVLAALFLMLGFYYISAGNFKHVCAAMPVWVTSLAVMFSLSSIVTHHIVIKNYIFEPVASSFAIYYFIGAFLVLLGFTSSPEAENKEKLIYDGKGFAIVNGENTAGFDTMGEVVFHSVKPETTADNAAVTEDDSYFAVSGFTVEGFLLDGEGEAAYIQHITTPNGVTLLNLVNAGVENMGDKLIKKTSDNYEKLDYLVVISSESTAELLVKLEKKLKFKNIIMLSLDDDTNAVSEKVVFTRGGEIVL
ncbi:MAG: hypothetical protein IJO47_06520 [Clostridia bacterium]|nr:hypothetical protein [Clostridia bacterium]